MPLSESDALPPEFVPLSESDELPPEPVPLPEFPPCPEKSMLGFSLLSGFEDEPPPPPPAAKATIPPTPTIPPIPHQSGAKLFVSAYWIFILRIYAL